MDGDTISSKAINSTRKRGNLMSIINSLHSNRPGLKVGSNPDAKTSVSYKDLDSGLPSGADDMEQLGKKSVNDGTCTSRKSQEEPKENGGDVPDDALSNMLNFLYQAASSSLNPRVFQQPGTELGDPPLLELQNSAIHGAKSGVIQLLECLRDGTFQVKSMLKNDVDLIFECKKCRGLFRALPNLIRHKKDYCKDTGWLSTFMNGGTAVTESGDTPVQQVLSSSKPKVTSTVPSEPTKPAASHGTATVRKALQPTFPPVTVPKFIGRNSVSSDRRPTPKVMFTKSGSFATLTKIPNSLNEDTGAGRSLSYMKPKSSYAMTPSYSSSQGISRKKPACPLCNKEMAERKNVRRHLVRVHMLSVMESLKLMHSKNPTVAGAKAIAESEMVEKGRSTFLMDDCIETLEIGDQRKIYVLPETYEVTSTQCPVCSRVLCSKTNLKRHILEAHNFVMKNEKKYFQLKLFSEKRSPNTPASLRTLRFLPPVLNTPENGSMFSNDKENDVTEQTQLKENVSKKEVTPRDTQKQDTIKSTGEDEVDNVKNTPPHTRNAGNSPSNKSTQANSEKVKEMSKQLDAALCRCLTCDKKFSRRQTLKNHMITFHKWTKEEFGEVYDNSNLEQSNADPAREDNMFGEKRSGSDEDKESLDDEDGENAVSKINGEPSAKRPKMLEVTIKRGASQGLPFQKDASHKLMAISKLAAATGGNRINMGTISIPLKNLPKVSLEHTNSNSNLSSRLSTSKNTQTTTITSTSHLTPQNGIDLFQSETSNDSVKRLVLRRLVTAPSSTTSSSTTSSSVSGPKSFIEVKVKQPMAAYKKTEREGVFSNAVKTTLNFSKASSETVAPKRTFDISKRECYMCKRTFETLTAVKRHLLEIHSFSIEDALGASYDCSDVSAQAQKAGQALGFDILLAKCLICSKYYFSRENLSKHMSKIHHLQPDALRHLNQATTQASGRTKETSSEKVKDKESHQQDKLKVKKSARIQANHTVATTPSSLDHGATSMQLSSTSMFTIVDKVWVISKESVAHALKVFPKECINPHALRCVKCKHKYNKAWDLKVHLLKHVVGLGLYACKYCPGPYMLVSCRSKDLFRHFKTKHNKFITNKDKNAVMAECRIDNKPLWEAYGLPVGKY